MVSAELLLRSEHGTTNDHDCHRSSCGSSRNRTPPPTGNPWRPSESRGVGPVKVLQEGWVSKVGMGDPSPVLRPIPYPVHQVVEPRPRRRTARIRLTSQTRSPPIRGCEGAGA